MSNKQEKNKVTDSENKSTRADGVRDWVEKQGYSLEMRVAKKFRDVGFRVSQFEHYIDQESQSVRPVDVVASLTKDIDNSTVNMKIFVECKYVANNKAWAIITTSERFSKYMYFSRVLRNKHPANWKTLDTLQGRLVGRLIQFAEGNRQFTFFTRKTAGYIVREALSDKLDYAHEAIAEISKSVEAHDIENEKFYIQTIESFERSEDLNSLSSLGLYFSIAIPMVVINGELYECSLTDDGQIDTMKVNHGIVLVPYRRRESNLNAQVTLSSVAIVTESHLDSYIIEMKNALETLLSNDEVIREIIVFERSNIYNPPLSDIGF
jgi:hypothetical protein